ncbi:MAG TPA: hypothetical protein VGH38_06245 [Bryobacteraceae bacterium]
MKDALARLRPDLLTLTAAFALFWVAARASIQSITIDEADTFLGFVGTPKPSHWIPASNNHVLNSMLMRLTTSLFGVSSLSMRLPALLGAVVYVAAVYLLIRLLTRSVALSCALFVCMVFNPLVMDHLVAARGYSMALAFLTAAVATAACRQSRGAAPYRTCTLCSLWIALSFCANFSFALIDATLLAGIAVWCGAPARTLRDYTRIAASAVLPGLLVALYFTGAILAHWPSNEFRWGATTFPWFMQSVGSQPLTQLSPYLVNSPLYDFLLGASPLLLPLLGAALLWRLAVLLRTIPALRKGNDGWPARLALLTAGSVLLAVGLHALLVWRFHLLWPLGRTGLYVPVLTALAIGALAAIPGATRMAAASQRALLAILLVIASYFILSLRLKWFSEWYWNANSDQVYNVAAYYNHVYGVRDIGTNWRYVAVLNFYRRKSGHETLHEVLLERPIPPGRDLYVLFPEDDEAFIRTQGLKVVYHDPLSDSVVAIRPGLEQESPK